MLIIILILIVSVIAFFSTPLGRELTAKMERANDKRAEKEYIDEMSKYDPLIKATYEARQKSIAELKENAEVQLAYNQYKLSLNRRQEPIPIEEFIEKFYIEPNAGTGQFTLNLDERGNILSVNLKGYGEVPLEMVKEYEPRAYAKIMQEYERFKRENNLS